MLSAKSYPDKMLAAFLEKEGGPLIVKEVRVPEPGPSEVLVKISAAPVNPSDLARLKNAHHENDLTTFIPGLEGSGSVVAAGKGMLPRFMMGRRVACSSAYNTSGTWAEYMVTKAGMCFPLSSSIDDEQGSMLLINPLTAIAFFEIIRKNRHKTIINNPAASALGRMIEHLAGENNIKVINIVRNQVQAEKLKSDGSIYVLDNSHPSFIDDLKALAGQLNANILFDAICSSQLQYMIGVLPANSSVVIYGNMHGNQTGENQLPINPGTLISNNIRISGFFLANYAKENGIVKVGMNILKARRLMKSDLRIVIRNRFHLTKIQEAVNYSRENMSAGKILIIPRLTDHLKHA